jgi:hypothetical protein
MKGNMMLHVVETWILIVVSTAVALIDVEILEDREFFYTKFRLFIY